MIKVKGIILLILISSTTFARCFVQVFLGHADAPRHFHRGEWVEERAKEMGCLVFKTHNMSQVDTEKALKDFFAKNNFDPEEDRLHISYVDHGSSSDLPYGGEFTSYSTALSGLDAAVPEGTDITFSSHICWPGFHEQLANSNFKNINSMCGASSVDQNHLANAWQGTTDWARNHEYLPSGWEYWASEYDEHEGNDFLQAIGIQDEDKVAGHQNTNLFNFHYQSLDNDVDNLLRGSSLTSLTFARNKLASIGHDTYKNPMDTLFSGDLSNIPLYDENKKVLGESNADDTCVHCSVTKLQDSGLEEVFKLSDFANQLDEAAIQTEIDNLARSNPQYNSFSRLYKSARNYIRNNELSIRQKVSNFTIRKEVLQRQIQYAESSGHYNKASKLQEDYKKLINEIEEDLKVALVKIRQLNDVEMIVKLKQESPSSMRTFESFIACERRNALDKI